jgi:twitching motility protein PilT
VAQRAKLTESQLVDVDASYFWHEENINFRLNVFHDRDGIACVIRMLPRRIPEIDTLGFWDEEVWQELVTMKHGLVLVTGGTGNGESTSIASLLNYINILTRIKYCDFGCAAKLSATEVQIRALSRLKFNPMRLHH